MVIICVAHAVVRLTFTTLFSQPCLIFFICLLLIPDKDKEIAFLKETLTDKEKQIARLKEKLSQVQQLQQTKEFDFVKKMATIDEELSIAKKNIDEATETLVENKAAEVEELHSELQIFNGKYVEPCYYDHFFVPRTI